MDASLRPNLLKSADPIKESTAKNSSLSDYYFRPGPWVDELVGKVDVLLETIVQSDNSMVESIGRHMLLGYAKRLRPIFVLLAQHLYKDETLDSTIECAAAAELIHCASLFHDDVIDGASTRKGRHAANAVWGNKSAVIMGDHFFVLAFTFLAKQQDCRLIELYVEMCRALAEGVMLEIGNTGNLDISEEEYFRIITGKTAVFFKMAAIVGGYLAGANPDESGHLAGFGLNFGLAFQLSDDLLDLFADPAATGKPRGSDIRSGILTVPVIHAISENPEFDTEFRPVLLNSKITSEDIDRITEELRSNGSMKYTQDLARIYGEKASAHLDQLPEGRANTTLRGLLDKITTREF